MMKVLVVDDSVVFRTQISASLKEVEGLEVVGTAANGKIALQKLEQSSVDLVTLDMEMPELNGIETLKQIRAKKINVKVIMFSSQTARGAESALEALREGADDIVAKPSGDNLNFESAASAVKEALVPKIMQFTDPTLNKLKKNLNSEPAMQAPMQNEKTQVIKPARINLDRFNPSVLLIASSTGGPTALEYIFSRVKGPYKIPVLIVQHMPPIFTDILSKRLSDLSGVDFHEARSGEPIRANQVYVAPGDFHLAVQNQNDENFCLLHQQSMRNSVRPAADYLFETAAKVYGSRALGVVLTGMGADGLCGAQSVRASGGAIAIQNKESCVVFGMPGAIYADESYDGIGDLDYIVNLLKKVLGTGV